MWEISSFSPSRRGNCVHTDRQHSVRSRRRGLHDPPQRAGHHGHPHLPTLALLQAHRGARWSGAHGEDEGEEAALLTCQSLVRRDRLRLYTAAL